MPATTVRLPVSALTPVRQAAISAKSDEAEMALVLANWLVQTEGPLLEKLIKLFAAELQQPPTTLSNERASYLIRLIAYLDERREQAELAADPARRAGIERIGEHFARKAQSGFSPHPLPLS